MSITAFERWFRGRFKFVGDHYLYWGKDGAVRFEPAEVDALFAHWRRLVANPVVWIAWVLLGVAVPLWLILQHNMAEALGIALAVAANVAMLVTLVHADNLVDQAAATRMLERLDGVRRPSLLGHLVWTAMCCFYVERLIEMSGREYLGTPALSLVVAFLLMGAILWANYRFVRDRQRWKAQLSGR